MAADTTLRLPPTSAPATHHWRLTRRERRNLTVGLLFISPWLAGFIIFLLYPIIYTIRISFTRYTGFGTPEWIGLQNYRDLIRDDLFWTAVYNTMYYTCLAVPIGAVVAMVLALAMNQPLPEVPIYRAIIYIPSVIPLFTLTFIYQNLMNPTQGLFNRFLIWLGGPNINWFGDPRYAKIALVILAQYGAGQAAIIFLAGLKGIPMSLYEAAMLDGAGSWRRFLNVTLPLMTPIILYDLILGLSLGLQIFTQVYIVSGVPIGGPANSTLVYVVYLYSNAFRYSALGYAAALAWILFLVTMILALLIFWSSKRWVNYDRT
ncbi:MAG: multiple sugar transport system permease protein [Thermomicrobiales bacterium]|nr:multiple sugar transport system permease protein [Thermomicrobiales bacterium]